MLSNALIAAAAVAGAVVVQSPPTVAVRNGTLQGVKCPSSNINSFLSIPFAEPPVGERRYTAPAPYDKAYAGIRDATEPAPACIQFGTSFVESGPQSEDCLFLNVWVPANATARSRLPVKVWLYGGFYAVGGISDPLYDGCRSTTDVIQVSVNYRLGPLGWMALQAAGLTGNYGLQDQLLALRWVQENIAAFGGDKTRVMLYGQSAGAGSSFAIAGLPYAPQLISSVVLQSGGISEFPLLSEAQKFYEFYAAQLNCSKSDLACLRSRTPEELNTTANNLPGYGSDAPSSNALTQHRGYGPQWGIVIDGHVLPRPLLEAGLQVPAIVGMATNEGSIFVVSQYQFNLFGLNQSHYDIFLDNNFGSFAGLVNSTYPIGKYGNVVYRAMSDVLTYFNYLCPAYRALTGAEPGLSVYAYQFNHTPSCSWVSGVPQAALPVLGPTHTADLAFTFGVFDHLPGGGNCTLSAPERALSGYIQDAWASMAATGSPGADWPVFSAAETRGMVFQDNATAGKIDYSVCGFWNDLAGKIAASLESQTNQSSTPTGTVPSPTNAAARSLTISSIPSVPLVLLSLGLAMIM